MEFKWADVERKSFKKIKKIVASNTLLAYPYFTKKIYIHRDDSDFQIRAVISQKVKPINFYSRKLTKS